MAVLELLATLEQLQLSAALFGAPAHVEMHRSGMDLLSEAYLKWVSFCTCCCSVVAGSLNGEDSTEVLNGMCGAAIC
jgi:hypothetical protein